MDRSLPLSSAARRSGLRIALAGGGTGGHIVPGRHLLAQQPGHLADVLWFCTGRPVEERAFAGIEADLDGVSIERVALALEPDGGGAPRISGLALRTLPAVRAARAALRAHRSEVLVGLGGFTCLPSVLAARSLGIPVALISSSATGIPSERAASTEGKHVKPPRPTSTSLRWARRAARAARTAGSVRSARPEMRGRTAVPHPALGTSAEVWFWWCSTVGAATVPCGRIAQRGGVPVAPRWL
ncbi:MAG: glycosyltransferase [Planctomycetota bacterium]